MGSSNVHLFVDFRGSRPRRSQERSGTSGSAGSAYLKYVSVRARWSWLLVSKPGVFLLGYPQGPQTMNRRAAPGRRVGYTSDLGWKDLRRNQDHGHSDKARYGRGVLNLSGGLSAHHVFESRSWRRNKGHNYLHTNWHVACYVFASPGTAVAGAGFVAFGFGSLGCSAL